MKKVDFKSIFIPTVSLFIICIIVAGLLSVTNAVTKEKIHENEVLSEQESMRSVCPDADTFDQTQISGVFAAKDSAGNIVGYAVSTVANGYGGQVKVMTGIKDSQILSIDVYYNDDETPGLGKNTSNDSFTKGFAGLSTTPDITVSKDYSGDGQPVDAVTSATISSRAVVSAVNEAVTLYNEAVQGGEQ